MEWSGGIRELTRALRKHLEKRQAKRSFWLASLFHASAICICLPAMTVAVGAAAYGAAVQEEREAPMQFTWVACEPHCRGWVGAVGIITGDTPKIFEEFAHGRDLDGATIVLDSDGGSVNDAITLGRHWRQIGLRTTVGSVDAMGERTSVAPRAWCESMCVFLLLSGTVRYVPEDAHVRVHQIWMSDRTEDAKASTYTARDMMIVERDIGRLAKYTFDMGGTGDLLSLSLDVPPWEHLHELTPLELQTTKLVTTGAVADVLPAGRAIDSEVASQTQDRLVSAAQDRDPSLAPSKTVEAASPAGTTAAASPAEN